jgi:hypothetical protein
LKLGETHPSSAANSTIPSSLRGGGHFCFSGPDMNVPSLDHQFSFVFLNQQFMNCMPKFPGASAIIEFPYYVLYYIILGYE